MDPAATLPDEQIQPTLVEPPVPTAPLPVPAEPIPVDPPTPATTISEPTEPEAPAPEPIIEQPAPVNKPEPAQVPPLAPVVEVPDPVPSEPPANNEPPAEPVAEQPKSQPIPPPAAQPIQNHLPASVLALSNDELRIAAALYLKNNQPVIASKGVAARKAIMNKNMGAIEQFIQTHGPSPLPRIAKHCNITPGTTSSYLGKLIAQNRIKATGHAATRRYFI